MINAAGIIRPAQTHGEVILSAIASRDLKTAQSQAKKYNIAHAFGSYDELLDSPLVDFVYISLPNGRHGEWAIKALEKGKHVLLEKPFTANEAEARRVVETAQRTGKIVMEAFHWQCHPASHAFKDILSKVRSIVRPSPSFIDALVARQDTQDARYHDLTHRLHPFLRYSLAI